MEAGMAVIEREKELERVRLQRKRLLRIENKIAH